MYQERHDILTLLPLFKYSLCHKTKASCPFCFERLWHLIFVTLAAFLGSTMVQLNVANKKLLNIQRVGFPISNQSKNVLKFMTTITGNSNE